MVTTRTIFPTKLLRTSSLLLAGKILILRSWCLNPVLPLVYANGSWHSSNTTSLKSQEPPKALRKPNWLLRKSLLHLRCRALKSQKLLLRRKSSSKKLRQNLTSSIRKRLRFLLRVPKKQLRTLRKLRLLPKRRLSSVKLRQNLNNFRRKRLNLLVRAPNNPPRTLRKLRLSPKRRFRSIKLKQNLTHWSRKRLS